MKRWGAGPIEAVQWNIDVVTATEPVFWLIFIVHLLFGLWMLQKTIQSLRES